jgi:hypothetical protein
MSIDLRPSVKIIQFPRRPIVRVNIASREVVADRASQAPRVEFGSGWYHEAAIQSDRQRKS